jgi:hypothetical protein
MKLPTLKSFFQEWIPYVQEKALLKRNHHHLNKEITRQLHQIKSQNLQLPLLKKKIQAVSILLKMAKFVMLFSNAKTFTK